MRSVNIPISKLFKSSISLNYFPPDIDTFVVNNYEECEIDIIINGYNYPELTNATVSNYLKYEKNCDFNIIIVESSGNIKIFDKIISGPRISKILIQDYDLKNNPNVRYGSGSFAMSLSAAVGTYLSKSKYIFYSHSDMLAIKPNFLSSLLNKLDDKTRIASFTIRHLIPFTGCMLIDRNAIDECDLDWMLYYDNIYIDGTECLKNLLSLEKKSSNPDSISCMRWIDCGEAFIYAEIQRGNRVFAGASIGGNDDYWKSVWDYLYLGKNTLELIQDCNCGIVYSPLNIDKASFENRYGNILDFSKSLFFEGERNNRKYWRYCFDDEGDLCFIHHGRGISSRKVKRWLKMERYLQNIQF